MKRLWNNSHHVTAPPVEQLALGTASWCVLQLAPETNDSVISHQLPSTVLHYPFHPYITLPHHLITAPFNPSIHPQSLVYFLLQDPSS